MREQPGSGAELSTQSLCIPVKLTLPVLPGDSMAGLGSSIIIPQHKSTPSAWWAIGRVLTGFEKTPSGRAGRAELGQEAGAVTLFTDPPRIWRGWLCQGSAGESELCPWGIPACSKLGPPHWGQEVPPRLARLAGVGLGIPEWWGGAYRE